MRRLKKFASLGLDVTREAMASVLTYELYPLGLIGRSVPTLPRYFIKEKKENLPILFIHGIFHNRAAFAWLKQKLALKGYTHFKEIDLVTSVHSIPILAEQVSNVVNQLLKQYSVREVNIIGHSLGGLVARYYIQKLGGDTYVQNLITLGTPHQGTRLSRFSLLHFKQLRPESELMQELSLLPPPKNTQVCAISGELDVIVRGNSEAWWKGVRHLHLKRVGHAGLLYSKRVSEIILAHLEDNRGNESYPA